MRGTLPQSLSLKIILTCMAASVSLAQQAPVPPEANAKQDARMKWFREAKFGDEVRGDHGQASRWLRHVQIRGQQIQHL